MLVIKCEMETGIKSGVTQDNTGFSVSGFNFNASRREGVYITGVESGSFLNCCVEFFTH